MIETPQYPRDPQQEVLVPADQLHGLLVKMFCAKGMYAVEAEIVASRLVEADLRGVPSHGSRSAKRYLSSMDVGVIDPRGQVIIESRTPAMAVMHGGRAVGHLAATKGMQLAIELAKSVGTGTVAIHTSQHFGAAAVYVEMAIAQGLIGYCTTSTGPATVSAYGSRTPATANNAFAWGAPVRSGPPFVLDMACAVSSWGKVHTELMYGGMIPAGWALDVSGQPTTDPKAAKTLLPAAGARGYGLAFLCSILAGPLVNGKSPLHKTGGVEQEGSEHFFYVLDPGRFGDREKYLDEMQQTIDEIRGMPPAEGFDRVRIPGELEWERQQRYLKNGIPLHQAQLEEIAEVARKLNLQIPW